MHTVQTAIKNHEKQENVIHSREKKFVNRNRPRSDRDNTVISDFKISDYKYIEAFKEKYNIMKLQVKNIKKTLNGNFIVENPIYEMKILMDGINYRLETTEEKKVQ